MTINIANRKTTKPRTAKGTKGFNLCGTAGHLYKTCSKWSCSCTQVVREGDEMFPRKENASLLSDKAHRKFSHLKLPSLQLANLYLFLLGINLIEEKVAVEARVTPSKIQMISENWKESRENGQRSPDRYQQLLLVQGWHFTSNTMLQAGMHGNAEG